MNNYKFDLAWSVEDEGYIATCPEFVGLSAFGETANEALAEAQVALKLFIETYEEKGIRLPEPKIIQDYSGQIRLRLSKSLHGQAAKAAIEDGISLNQFIMLAVQARVTGQDVAGRISLEVKEHLITNPTPPLRRTENQRKLLQPTSKTNNF
jgi:predicted RNase H-like HicB family nuclease